MKLHPVMENIAHETEAATRASMRTMRAALSSERKALHSRLIPWYLKLVIKIRHDLGDSGIFLSRRYGISRTTVRTICKEGQ
jgi:hypothetical protein